MNDAVDHIADSLLKRIQQIVGLHPIRIRSAYMSPTLVVRVLGIM